MELAPDIPGALAFWGKHPMAVGIEYRGRFQKRAKKRRLGFRAALSGHPMGFVVDTVQGPLQERGSLSGAGSPFLAKRRNAAAGERVWFWLRTKQSLRAEDHMVKVKGLNQSEALESPPQRS